MTTTMATCPAPAGTLERLGADLSAATTAQEAALWALEELHLAIEARSCRVAIEALRPPYRSRYAYRLTVTHQGVAISVRDTLVGELPHAIHDLLGAFRG